MGSRRVPLRVPRRLVFGWFVGMASSTGSNRAARSLLRGAARAAPVVPAVLPALAYLDLRAIAAQVDGRRSSSGASTISGWDNGPVLADALGAEELVLPGVGHMPMIEAPYSFGVAVADFV